MTKTFIRGGLVALALVSAASATAVTASGASAFTPRYSAPAQPNTTTQPRMRHVQQCRMVRRCQGSHCTTIRICR